MGMGMRMERTDMLFDRHFLGKLPFLSLLGFVRADAGIDVKGKVF